MGVQTDLTFLNMLYFGLLLTLHWFMKRLVTAISTATLHENMKINNAVLVIETFILFFFYVTISFNINNKTGRKWEIIICN